MCHHYSDTERVKDEIARELLDELESESDAAERTADDVPSFLNEERDAEVDILTDGGSAE